MSQPQTGTIIITLNGPSAAGKSSIQKQFQKISDELYLTVGIDGSSLILSFPMLMKMVNQSRIMKQSDGLNLAKIKTNIKP